MNPSFKPHHVGNAAIMSMEIPGIEETSHSALCAKPFTDLIQIDLILI